jgi:ATP-dependent Lhr-like helicase
MALEAAWDEVHGYQLEVYVSNDAIMLQLHDQTSKEEILSLVRSANLGDLLRRKLESSGYFGARFRENAGRALLLPRRKGNERMPLWLSRLRSQKLLSSVMRFHDFPILLETWRTCLRDDFDMDSLQRILGELESGIITCSETHTSSPSPMARSATWGQINRYMYLDDSMKSGKADNSKMSGGASMLRRDFIQDVIFTPALRPAVSESVIEQFELKRKRLIPGYSPETSRDLLDWVKERLLIPASEWERLLEMAHADHHIDRSAPWSPLLGRWSDSARPPPRNPCWQRWS